MKIIKIEKMEWEEIIKENKETELQKEKEVFEKFIEVREQNKQVSLTIEFAENGFWIRIFKRKRVNKPARYADDEIVFNYKIDENVEKAFEILQEKIREVGK